MSPGRALSDRVSSGRARAGAALHSRADALRWPRAIASIGRLGQGGALTIWSWLIPFPFVMTVLSAQFSAAAPVWADATDWSRAIGTFGTHLVTGLLMFVAKTALDTVRAGTPRLVAAFVAFALLGATRPFVLSLAMASDGDGIALGDLTSRIAVNVVGAVIGLTIIAVVVGGLRDTRRARSRLLSAEEALIRLAAMDDAALEVARREHLADLERRLRAAIEQVPEAGGRLGTATTLRRLSEDVVRPMSHELLDLADTDQNDAACPEADAREAASRPERTRGIGRAGDGAGRLSTFTAIGPAWPVTLFALLITPYLLRTHGVAIALLLLAVGVVWYSIGSAVVRAIADTIRSGVCRLCTVAGGSVIVAACGSALTAALLTIIGRQAPYAWSALLIYPAVVVAVALGDGIARELANAEEALSVSLQEQAALAAASRRRLRDTRVRIARVLHGTAQADLVAVAFALSAGAGAGAGAGTRSAEEVVAAGSDSASESGTDEENRPSDRTVAVPSALAMDLVRDTVADMLQRVTAMSGGADADEPDETDDARRVRSVLDTWASVLDLTIDVDPGVWEWLAAPVQASEASTGAAAASAARADAIVEILTEGFTNAVRHGTGRAARVRITAHTDQVAEPIAPWSGCRVSIRSVGAIRAGHAAGRVDGRGDGRGLSLLRGIASSVELVDRGGTVELIAIVV
ncbi:hypothetical protein ACL9RL_01730 [Plantibacter sp. Mn2098]|uniref:hypothetical protein n=1 Tax=Plantibacter sp. Mn2098 TaxID=3395266 RepID=UPI003BC1B552